MQEDYIDGSDGSWNGVNKYFDCQSNNAKFVLLGSLKPDERFNINTSPGKIYVLSANTSL